MCKSSFQYQRFSHSARTMAPYASIHVDWNYDPYDLPPDLEYYRKVRSTQRAVFGGCAAKKRTTERKGSSHVDWNYHLYDFFPDQEFYRKLVVSMSSSVYLGSLI